MATARAHDVGTGPVSKQQKGHHVKKKPLTILMADDDEEDRLLVFDAWDESRLDNDLRVVNDGEELMDYLHRRGRYADPNDAPRPGLILLDLNMPKMDGRECLGQIKSDPDLRQIPVIALTSSTSEEDVLRTYDLGVNAYMTKPVTYEKLIEALKSFGAYWLELVRLPTPEDQGD